MFDTETVKSPPTGPALLLLAAFAFMIHKGRKAGIHHITIF